jgi:hypothetical protein
MICFFLLIFELLYVSVFSPFSIDQKQKSRSNSVNASCLLNLLDLLLCSANKTGTSGGNKTTLLPGGSESGNSWSMTNMLMITTTVGMINGVHGNTTGLWPGVALDSVLVVRASSLEQGFIDTTTSSNDSNGGATFVWDNLLGARHELDAGLSVVWVLAEHDCVVSGNTREWAAIANLWLDVGDNGSFRHGREWEDVTDSESSLLSAVDKLASEHTFSRNESFLLVFILVGVSESDLCEGSASTGIVDDWFDDSSNVSVSLRVVEGSVFSSALSTFGVRFEDSTCAFSLCSNYAAHFKRKKERRLRLHPELQLAFTLPFTLDFN